MATTFSTDAEQLLELVPDGMRSRYVLPEHRILLGDILLPCLFCRPLFHAAPNLSWGAARIYRGRAGVSRDVLSAAYISRHVRTST
jgi:hypothetical protein